MNTNMAEAVANFGKVWNRNMFWMFLSCSPKESIQSIWQTSPISFSVPSDADLCLSDCSFVWCLSLQEPVSLWTLPWWARLTASLPTSWQTLLCPPMCAHPCGPWATCSAPSSPSRPFTSPEWILSSPSVKTIPVLILKKAPKKTSWLFPR